MVCVIYKASIVGVLSNYGFERRVQRQWCQFDAPQSSQGMFTSNEGEVSEDGSNVDGTRWTQVPV